MNVQYEDLQVEWLMAWDSCGFSSVAGGNIPARRWNARNAILLHSPSRIAVRTSFITSDISFDFIDNSFLNINLVFVTAKFLYEKYTSFVKIKHFDTRGK